MYSTYVRYQRGLRTGHTYMHSMYCTDLAYVQTQHVRTRYIQTYLYHMYSTCVVYMTEEDTVL